MAPGKQSKYRLQSVADGHQDIQRLRQEHRPEDEADGPQTQDGARHGPQPAPAGEKGQEQLDAELE